MSNIPLVDTLKTSPRIKIGLVGLNFGRSIVNQLMGPIASPLFELTALCDIDEGRLEKARPNDSVTLYRKIDDLLKDKNVEVVGLFTGPSGRADLLRNIVETGRDVITTKPLEVSADAMLTVLHEAKKLNRVVHCNLPGPLLADDLEVVGKWVEKYQLGRPVGARADVWVSYREKADGGWYDDPKRCPAAPIYRLGIYMINDLIRMWGKVIKIQLLQSRIFTGRPTTDNAQVGLLFENQAIVNIYASFCVKDGDHYRNGMVLNYENGTIYRNTGPAWTELPASEDCPLALVQYEDNRPKLVVEEKVASRSGEYQWVNFAKAVRGEKLPHELTPEQMVESIRVMEEIARLGAGEI